MATDAERVRQLLGEQIPNGGTEADTNFTDAQILDLLSQNDNGINSAVAEGWRVKAAIYADLVDTAEGTSRRAMSDLHTHALRMVDSYTDGAGAPVRTKVRQIVRK